MKKKKQLNKCIHFRFRRLSPSDSAAMFVGTPATHSGHRNQAGKKAKPAATRSGSPTSSPVTKTHTTDPTRFVPTHTVQDRFRHRSRPNNKTPANMTPIQTQMQTDSIQLLPMQNKRATRCNSKLKLACYISYPRKNYEKWMDHLLILTTLFSAELLNCLGWYPSAQTLPFNLLIKIPEKWRDQLLILTYLPWAETLDCLELFITAQTWSFNPVRFTCLGVLVEYYELGKNPNVKGDSLNSIVTSKVSRCNV